MVKLRDVIKLNRDTIKSISDELGIPEEKVSILIDRLIENPKFQKALVGRIVKEPWFYDALADRVAKDEKLRDRVLNRISEFYGRRSFLEALALGAGITIGSMGLAKGDVFLTNDNVVVKDPSTGITWDLRTPLPFSAIVGIEGSKVRAYDWKGGLIDRGKAVEDDARVIQSAVDALPEGGTIFIRRGRYKLVGQNFGIDYKYVGLLIHSNIKLVGEGMYSTIFTTDSIPSGESGGYFVAIANKNYTTGDGYIVIENIGFDLPTPLYEVPNLIAWDGAIYFRGVYNSIIKQVWVRNGRIGLGPNTTYYATPDALTKGNNYGNIICDCILEDCSQSIGISQGSNCWFVRNRIIKTWDDALHIGGAGIGHKILFNYIDNSPVVSGTGGSTAAIYLDNDRSVDTTPNGMKDILILGNIVKSNRLNGGARAGIGIRLAKGIKVLYNYIYDCAGAGINLFDQSCINIKIEGNEIFDNDLDGIFANTISGYTLEKIDIIGNIIHDNGRDGILLHAYGIIKDIKISENRLYGNALRGLDLIQEVGGSLEVDVLYNYLLDVTPVRLYGSPIVSFKNNKGYTTENQGISTITGDGTTTTFTVDVTHGLVTDDPTKIAVTITPSKACDVDYAFVDTDGDGFAETLRMTLTFGTAPASGEVVYISWRAEVVS